MGLLIAVFSLFSLALPAPWIARRLGAATGWILSLLPLSLAFYFLSFIGPVAGGETIRASLPWVPSLGIHLSMTLDGLSLLFALLICGIGALILVYAGIYLGDHPHLGRFFVYLLVFMASMLGLVLSDNLLALFLFWELTSISSYLLIGFHHEQAASRAAALQALLVTGGGGLAMLAGFLLLAGAGGSLEISELRLEAEAIRDHALYLPLLLLILLGAFTKSAQYPFHFWLPGAMEAPTPVSAYLHSATMVKAGIYLLARLAPTLGGTDAWTWLLTAFGGATMLAGGFLALNHTDLKRILAYSTISALGTMVMALGLNTPQAVTAGMVFLFAHALYKGALFMVAGILDHQTGTRDVDRLGGLRPLMPITAAVAILSAVSLAGLGPVLSFIGKELLLEAVLESPTARLLLTPGVTLAGALFVAVAGIVALRPFFGTLGETPKRPHEAPMGLWLGPALLSVAGLLTGVFPGATAHGIIGPAVSAVLDRPETVKLALWHGLSPALALSGLSLLLGFGLYRWWESLRRVFTRFDQLLAWGPAQGYQAALDGMNAVAAAQTGFFQNGYLRYYVMTVIGSVVMLAGTVLATRNVPIYWENRYDVRFYEAGLALLILLGALGAVLSRSRLATVASLGVVGYGVALVFTLYGAPDLAMTQFLIETLTVILFVLVFYHLPPFVRRSPPSTRIRDLFIALPAGALMTVLTLIATHVQVHEPISRYFAENSLPRAHGRNIVNVILVDFRALDTLGEITVLALAGMGVFALLKLRLDEPEPPGGEGGGECPR